MTEGKYKTNVKPPYLECCGCKYRGPNYNFIHGMWWWKTIKCPECGSAELQTPAKPKIAPAPQILKDRMDNKRHLQFIYDRLRFVYGENKNIDYMRKFKEIIDK